MPAPGDQHERSAATANPYETQQPRMSELTAKEIASLSSKLDKRLGPEYISARPGAAGQKVHYLAADKCINLANEVFGFNGWSSAIQNINVDFMDENQTTGKVNLGISVVVRVTLRDGNYHEDIGYGHIENCKGKAAAFEKAKKEGTTDALKRALRNFGNVLGNCIYDKEYVAKVTKMKVVPRKWDSEDLHRHSDFVYTKKEPGIDMQDDALKNLPSFGELEDEFGGDEFDEVDFSESHNTNENPDEVVIDSNGLQKRPKDGRPSPGHSEGQRNPQARAHQNQPGPNSNRPQPLPAAPPQANVRQAPPKAPQSRPNGAQESAPPTSGPRLPNNASHTTNQANGDALPPPSMPAQRPRQQPPPGRPTGESPGVDHGNGHNIGNAPPAAQVQATSSHDPPVGFYNARAAPLVQDSAVIASPNAAPTFNPHSESPSIRKTAGVDHTKSKPIDRETLSHPPNPPTSNAASVPPTGPLTPGRANFTNPQLDTGRKIGMPGSPAIAAPVNNRGSYKPPWPAPGKRATDGAPSGSIRAPLGEVPAEQLNATAKAVDAGGGGDAKKQKVNGN